MVNGEWDGIRNEEVMKDGVGMELGMEQWWKKDWEGMGKVDWSMSKINLDSFCIYRCRAFKFEVVSCHYVQVQPIYCCFILPAYIEFMRNDVQCERCAFENCYQ